MQTLSALYEPPCEPQRNLTLDPSFALSFCGYRKQRAHLGAPARSWLHSKELKARYVIAGKSAGRLRQGLEALRVLGKAAFLFHLNNMGLPAILAHKAATGLKGGAHNIAQASASEALAQPF